MQQDRGAQTAMLRKAPEVRGKIHVTVPGEYWAARASRRQAVEPVVDHRNGLNQRWLISALRNREERTAERQHARSVRGSALRKQHQVVAQGQPLAHGIT